MSKEDEVEIIDPLDLGMDDDLDWLELNNIPTEVYNPLLDYPIDASPDPIEEMVSIMRNPEYLHFAAKHLLCVELLPFQCVILDTLWRKKMPMLIGSRGCGKCVKGDTYCQTDEGLLRIDEIVSPNTEINSKVKVNQRFKGEKQYNNIEYGWNNGYGESIKLTTSYGYTIEGTPNHPIRVLENEEIAWKELKDITQQDIIVIDRSHYSFGKNNVDNDFAWWLGATIGDGMVCQPTYILLTNIDQDIVKLWCDIGFKLSGKKATNPKSCPKNYFLRSREFNKYVNEEIGLNYKKAKEKTIPKFIRTSSKENVANFLSGLFDTDGGCTGVGIEYCTVSEEMSIQVQSCLLAFGILARRRVKTIKNKSGTICIAYIIVITGVENLILFRDKINFRCVRKRDSLEKLCRVTSNPNRDILPFQRKILKLTNKYKSVYDKNINPLGSYNSKLISPSRTLSYSPSYETADKILAICKEVEQTEEWKSVKNIVNTKYFYDRVKKIESGFCQTYDVNMIDDHSFITNGFISHNSYILAIYSLLRMIFHPGCKIVIIGAAFRQAKAVFDYMVSIWDRSPLLRDVAGSGRNAGPRREVDKCEFTIGTSKCVSIPLGDGSKIRGQRANYILVDERASVPNEIFNVVVSGFGVVASEPVDKVKEAALVRKLKRMGQWSDELETIRKIRIGGNQIVSSGTAYYAFNHFCKSFQKWHKIISSKGDMSKLSDTFADDPNTQDGFDWKDYAILRIPYTKVPDGLLDPGILAQAKASLHHSQFLMEYAACFPSDSDGFYKRSVIESATTNKPIQMSNGELVQFNSIRNGDPKKVYVMGVDPAADQDNAAMVVLELNGDHRRVVHCWTTNRKKHNSLKKYLKTTGIEIENDYYVYVAKKIREMMRFFNIERIIMDKNGGGVAIAESLSSQKTCLEGEFPVYEIIDPEDPKPDDMEQGLHLLQLLSPNSEINSDANHGMLKDLQDRVLLFPMFDTIEMEKAMQLDKLNDTKFDTYEDLVQEIEELKNEMTTIVVTESSALGKESFDTPSIKAEGSKKGHLKKDRYSALLYANYYSRNKDRQTVITMQYKPVGGTKNTLSKSDPNKNESMYHGPGLLKFKANFLNVNPAHTFRKGHL